MSEKKQAKETETVSVTDERKNRIAKIEKWQELGVNPYPNYYKPEAFSEDIKKEFEENGDTEFSVKIAGRIILYRSFGKAGFATIKDKKGSIQVYGRKDIMDEATYAKFKMLDIGDIVGIEGDVFRTHKGEITVLVKDFTLLSKAINSLPEKFHGLTDTETRYRQRYVDLIINDEVKQDFIARSKVIAFIRKFLLERNFMEVETPMMQTIPGGASARPFMTHHNALDMDLYLRIAPELYLKRLIVGGFDRVFELNRNFRNEGIDTKHNPEFTMMEVYQSYADFKDMMELFESITKGVAIEVKGTAKFEFQGRELDFGNWNKIKYVDSLKEIGGIDVSGVKTREDAIKLAETKGIKDINANMGKWGIINILFEEYVEEKLEDPTIVYEYPTEISPLAKTCPDNEEFVERFEAFCMKNELCNAFSELNNPFVQKERFEAQAAKKAGGDDEAMFMDLDYVNALEYGMPPTGGLGIGIDRLVMFLIDTISIRDSILFPTMKIK